MLPAHRAGWGLLEKEIQARGTAFDSARDNAQRPPSRDLRLRLLGLKVTLHSSRLVLSSREFFYLQLSNLRDELGVGRPTMQTLDTVIGEDSAMQNLAHSR